MDHCECKICKRSTQFALLVEKVEDENARKFFMDIYGALLGNEFEVDLLQLKVEELRDKFLNLF